MHRNNFKNSCFINMFNEPNPTMNSCLKEFQISFHEFLTNQNESCLFVHLLWIFCQKIPLLVKMAIRIRCRIRWAAFVDVLGDTKIKQKLKLLGLSDDDDDEQDTMVKISSK